MWRLLMSFSTYMRFAHRHGPRTRWRDERGHWHVRGRVEPFLEPALLLWLAEPPAHGYALADCMPGQRPREARAVPARSRAGACGRLGPDQASAGGRAVAADRDRLSREISWSSQTNLLDLVRANGKRRRQAFASSSSFLFSSITF